MIQSLINRNDFIRKANEDNLAELRVIKIVRSRDVVIQCTWHLFDQITTKRFVLFHQNMTAERYIDTRQCYNCLGFQHYSSECRNRGIRGKTCAKCGEEGHAYDRCVNRKIECCNCTRVPGLPSNHWATSNECPKVKQAIDEYLRRTLRYPKDMPEDFFIKPRQLPNRLSKRKEGAEIIINSPTKKTKRSYDNLDGNAVKAKLYTRIDRDSDNGTMSNSFVTSMETCENRQQDTGTDEINTNMNDSGTSSTTNADNPANKEGLSNINDSNVSLSSTEISDTYNDAQTPSQILSNENKDTNNMHSFSSIKDNEGNEIKILDGRLQKANAMELIKMNNTILYKDEFDRQYIIEENYRVYLDDQITKEDMINQELSLEKMELIEKLMNPQ